MRDTRAPIGRRERAKQDKRERIMVAARQLFALHGVDGVTTQQIADRADIAIGTLPVRGDESGAVDHGAEPEVRDGDR